MYTIILTQYDNVPPNYYEVATSCDQKLDVTTLVVQHVRKTSY